MLLASKTVLDGGVSGHSSRLQEGIPLVDNFYLDLCSLGLEGGHL